MDNHFTITIHDDHGVKQFNLHQIMKKALIYMLMFIASIGLMGIGTILYLNYSVDKIELKRQSVEEAYVSLKKRNEELNNSIKNAQFELTSKQEELLEVSASLSEIEALIGLAPVEEMTLQERANETKLNSEHMTTLMQFIPSGSPIEYTGLTSDFGYRIHPTLNRKEFHNGLDLKAKMDTPVYATADGIAEWASFHEKSGFGNLVVLQHNYGFKSYFAHLNKIVIKSGKFVKKGDLIAYTGSSGMSSGPHLHYELRFIQRVINPNQFVAWSVKNFKDIFQKEKQIPWQSLIKATAHIKVPKPTQTPQLSPLVLGLREK